MKHWHLVTALICFGSTAHAAPYFRPIDLNHPYKSIGAYIDPKDPGNSSGGTAIALITHSTKDGCILPSVVCEDWSPLMMGLSANAGHLSLNLGPAANLAPIAQAGLERLFPAWPFGGDGTVSIAFGPALNVSPIQHGAVLPINAWQGQLRIFAGAALQF